MVDVAVFMFAWLSYSMIESICRFFTGSIKTDTSYFSFYPTIASFMKLFGEFFEGKSKFDSFLEFSCRTLAFSVTEASI